MGFVVKKPGVLASVQDMGRVGHMGSGFSPSGAMDARALSIGNLLVENDIDAPAIEFALAGPTLRFTSDTYIAITGGNFSPTLDEKPISSYKTYRVRRGSILRISAATAGVYGYVCIAGGSVRVPEVLGSYSTNLKAGIGGFHGRLLQAGDYLPFVTKYYEFMPNLGSHAIDPDPYYDFESDVIKLRVVLGPQDDMFTLSGIDKFLTEQFTVSTKCDRMGYRLDGPEIETTNGSDIISDGIALGAIQVPSHGRPIIMLADRQTTGGYAKIATVISADIPKLVQAKAGKMIEFESVSVQEAQEILTEQAKYLRKLRKSVKRPCAGGVSPRRTARRLKPILEQQALKNESEPLWIHTH